MHFRHTLYYEFPHSNIYWVWLFILYNGLSQIITILLLCHIQMFTYSADNTVYHADAPTTDS